MTEHLYNGWMACSGRFYAYPQNGSEFLGTFEAFDYVEIVKTGEGRPGAAQWLYIKGSGWVPRGWVNPLDEGTRAQFWVRKNNTEGYS